MSKIFKISALALLFSGAAAFADDPPKAESFKSCKKQYKIDHDKTAWRACKQRVKDANAAKTGTR